MNIFLLILWFIAGVVTLITGDIGRLEYSLVWGMLILKYIESIEWDKRKKRIMQNLDNLKIELLKNNGKIDWSEED